MQIMVAAAESPLCEGNSVPTGVLHTVPTIFARTSNSKLKKFLTLRLVARWRGATLVVPFPLHHNHHSGRRRALARLFYLCRSYIDRLTPKLRELISV